MKSKAGRYLCLSMLFCFLSVKVYARETLVVKDADVDYGADSLCSDALYTSIQTAIDDANDRDDVVVCYGSYFESIDFMGKAIKVHSKSGPEVTFIDGNNENRVILFNSDEDIRSVLKGFTIQNGNATHGAGIYCSSSPKIINCTISGNTNGSGIYCSGSSSSPTIVNCRISGNTSNENGGGVYGFASSSPKITNCTISGNTSQRGGGIYLDRSNSSLTNCTISENTSQYEGGGIYVTGSGSPSLTNCTISGNTSQYSRGGGVYLGYSVSSFFLTNCTISENTSQYGGGGVYATGSGSSSLTNCTISGNTTMSDGGGVYLNYGVSSLTNCTISGNASQNGSGGGVYLYSSDSSLTNCTISGNMTNSNGGGIYSDSSSPVIMNCTLSGNISGSDGGGIYIYNYSQPVIQNSILWGDMPDEIFNNGGTLTTLYSDIQEGWEGERNIDENPLFVNPILASEAPNSEGNYHLQGGSPCIDTGTDVGAPAGDIDGDSRPQDGDRDGTVEYDMGSDEYLLPVSLIIGQIFTRSLSTHAWDVTFRPGEIIKIQQSISIIDPQSVSLNLVVRCFYIDPTGQKTFLSRKTYRDYLPGTYLISRRVALPDDAIPGMGAVRSEAVIIQGEIPLAKAALEGRVNILVTE